MLAAQNNLSEHNFVAPYKFIGETALSVDKATTLLTLFFIAELIIFCAPKIFVLIHSKGLYSVAGTCFRQPRFENHGSAFFRAWCRFWTFQTCFKCWWRGISKRCPLALLSYLFFPPFT